MSDRAIRILHVCETSGTGGAETVLLNLVGGLDTDRFASEVVLFRTGWLHDKLRHAGISTHVPGGGGSFDFGLVMQLRKLSRSLNIDLIHSHLPDANAYAALASRFSGTPQVATYHGHVEAGDGKFDKQRIKLSMVRRFAAHTVAVSDYLRKELMEFGGFSEDKMTRIYNGVDFDRYKSSANEVEKNTTRQSLGLDPTAPLIGMVANLRPAKGYEYFVQAAGLIAREIPEAHFVILGDGPEGIKNRIKGEIQKEELTGKVHLLGYREDVPQILRSMDVFLLSSITEGLSIATIEAIAAGVPVVVTASGGPQEIVDDGRTGFVVPPRDPQAMAGKALGLLRDVELTQKITTDALECVRERFGLQSMISQYESIYRSCVKRETVDA